MVYALSVVIGLLLLQSGFVWWNLRHLNHLENVPRAVVNGAGVIASGGSGSGGMPLISILIPARDEERNIEDCLRSVLESAERAERQWLVACGGGSVGESGISDEQGSAPGTAPPLIEVLVLDDRSSDGTAELAARCAATAPRLRLLAGDDLPAGWTGKSWACHQLSRQAGGRWLLYLDADARLEPDALARICSAINFNAAQPARGMWTGFPRQIVHGFLERLVVPLMNFTIACHLPIRLVRHAADPKFAAAHGAFILIARETYDRCGGHAQFREHLVDDVMLARAVKRSGDPLHLLNVTDLVCMRMYQSNGEVWRGYKKNIFPGMGRNHGLVLLLMVLYGGLYLFPWVALFIAGIGLMAAEHSPGFVEFALAAAACLLGISLKWRIDSVNRTPAWVAWFLPWSILFMLLIMVDSWRVAVTGKSYEWKGRRYQ